MNTLKMLEIVAEGLRDWSLPIYTDGWICWAERYFSFYNITDCGEHGRRLGVFISSYPAFRVAEKLGTRLVGYLFYQPVSWPNLSEYPVYGYPDKSVRDTEYPVLFVKFLDNFYF